MKNLKLFVVLFLTAILFSCKPDLKTVKISSGVDSASYALGVAIAPNFQNQFTEINPLALAKAIEDVYQEKETMFSTQEANEFLQSYLYKEFMGKSDDNKSTGEAFLAENKTKEGVVELESGLQYKIIEEGVGPSPKETDKVKVHYTGKLINGKVFDSSYDRGQPAVFQLNRVIKGWTEGLKLMNAGAKYELYIPSELAYGERGAGNNIGPNETLIFEVELLEIVKE